MTIRTYAELTTLFADNVTGAISPADLRDFLDSQRVYGSIVIQGGSTAQTFVSTTPELLTEWTADGISNGVTPAFATDKITIDHTGIYSVNFFCSFAGANPVVNSFELRIDDVATGLQFDRKTTSTDIGSGSFSGIISLTAAEVLTVWGTLTGGTSITVQEAALVVHRIS